MESYRVPELFYLETQARIQEQFNLNHDRAQRFVDTVVEKARRDGIITDSYVMKLNYETTFQSETILSVRREFLVDIKTGTALRFPRLYLAIRGFRRLWCTMNYSPSITMPV